MFAVSSSGQVAAVVVVGASGSSSKVAAVASPVASGVARAPSPPLLILAPRPSYLTSFAVDLTRVPVPLESRLLFLVPL